MWKRGEDMTTTRDEQVRKQALHIVFAALHRDGRTDIWLAQQLGINKSRLWNYKSGKNRVPEWIVEQSAHLVNEQVDRVYRIAPRETLIQQQGEWRGRKPASRKAANDAATSQHNTSNTSSSRNKRHPAQSAIQPTSSALDAPTRRRRDTGGYAASSVSSGVTPAH